MEWLAPLIGLLAVLFLVGRRLPGQAWLMAVAAALAFIVAVLLLERLGLWPESWRTR